jgi:hypothetical protein
MSEKEYSQARTVELLDLSTKLTTPPNPSFKKIKTQKYFSQKGIVEGVETQILFNPYLLSLAISEIYFRLNNDRRIHQWCSEGHIRRESIEKVVKIIEDKYSYRFVELLSIAEEFFIRIYDSDNETKLKLYSDLTGLNDDLIHSYIGWTFEFYEDELIPTIQSQLGKLVYS